MRRRTTFIEFLPLLLLAAVTLAAMAFAEDYNTEVNAGLSAYVSKGIASKLRCDNPATIQRDVEIAGRPREWQICEVVGNKLDNCRDATEGDHLDVTLVALGLKPGWAVWRRR